MPRCPIDLSTKDFLFLTPINSELARATTVTVDTPLTDLAEFTKERKTIRLDCLCDGGRCDINKVKWFKDGREVRLDYATYLVVDDRLEMFTRNREQIVGEYYCKSQNDKSDIAIVKDSCKLYVFECIGAVLFKP